jgi:hypothetical protein
MPTTYLVKEPKSLSIHRTANGWIVTPMTDAGREEPEANALVYSHPQDLARRIEDWAKQQANLSEIIAGFRPETPNGGELYAEAVASLKPSPHYPDRH